MEQLEAVPEKENIMTNREERNRQLGRGPVGPAREHVELTDDEKKLFELIVKDFVSESDDETRRFLDGHRSESQGE